VAGTFLCASVLPAWAQPFTTSHLRPSASIASGTGTSLSEEFFHKTAADGGGNSYRSLDSYRAYVRAKTRTQFRSERDLVAYLQSLRTQELSALTDYTGRNFKGDKGRQLAKRIGILTEGIVRAVLRYYQAKPDLRGGERRVALLAGGSYGRQEMTGASDLELVLIQGRQTKKSFVRWLLKILPSRLEEIGFSEVDIYPETRIKELFSILGRSTIDLINLLESRTIAGDRGLLRDFKKERRQFISKLTPEERKRHLTFDILAHFSQSGLEKERPGDRRDLSRIVWLSFLADFDRKGPGTIHSFEHMSQFMIKRGELLVDERKKLLAYLDRLLWAAHLKSMNLTQSQEEELQEVNREIEDERSEIAQIILETKATISKEKIQENIKNAWYSSDPYVLNDLYESAEKSQSWTTMAALANNPSTPTEILGDFVRKNEYHFRDLRFFTAMNPSAPLWLLLALSRDDMKYIQDVAKGRLQTEWVSRNDNIIQVMERQFTRGDVEFFFTDSVAVRESGIEIGKRQRVAVIGKRQDGWRDIIGEGEILIADPDKVKIVSWYNEDILNRSYPEDDLGELMGTFPDDPGNPFPGLPLSEIVEANKLTKIEGVPYKLIYAMNSFQSNFWQPLGFLIVDGKLIRKADGALGLNESRTKKYEPINGEFTVFVISGDQRGIRKVTIKNNQLQTKGVSHAISGPALLKDGRDLSGQIREAKKSRPETEPFVRDWEPDKVGWDPEVTKTSFSAIGLSSERQFIFLSVFGNSGFGGKDFSEGVDVRMMAQIMQSLGAKDALHLGGSADVTLWRPDLPAIKKGPPKLATREKVRKKGSLLRPVRPLNAAILVYAPEKERSSVRDGGWRRPIRPEILRSFVEPLLSP